MKTTLFLTLLTLVQVLYAREDSLEHLGTSLDAVYRYAGEDNNSIAQEHFRTTNLKEILTKLQKQANQAQIIPIKEVELKSLIKECVFISQGAYGPHINSEEQKKLYAFYLEETYKFTQAPNVYLVRNVQYNMINNNCAILLTSRRGDESIILQGVSVD